MLELFVQRTGKNEYIKCRNSKKKKKNLMKQVACLSFNLSLRNFSRQALDPGLLYESLRPLKVIIVKIIMNILELTQVDQDERSPSHF